MADQLGITSSEKFIMRSAELQDLQSAGLPKNQSSNALENLLNQITDAYHLKKSSDSQK